MYIDMMMLAVIVNKFIAIDIKKKLLLMQRYGQLPEPPKFWDILSMIVISGHERGMN
jgi:hypothetical protein